MQLQHNNINDNKCFLVSDASNANIMFWNFRAAEEHMLLQKLKLEIKKKKPMVDFICICGKNPCGFVVCLYKNYKKKHKQKMYICKLTTEMLQSLKPTC